MDAVAVVVKIAQPIWQAVLHGKRDVMVGVVGQALAGPGMVVMLSMMHSGMTQALVKAGQSSFET